MKGNNLAMFKVFEISLLFAIDFETFVKLRNFREQIETMFVLLDEFRLLLGPLLFCLEPHALGNEVFNSLDGIVSSPVK